MNLSHSTPEMTEFKKFLFFREKADQLNSLRSSYFLLLQFSNITLIDIRKRLHISEDRWYRYLRGDEPLPFGLYEKFKVKLDAELESAQHAKDIAYMTRMRDRLFLDIPSRLKTDSADVSPVEATPMDAPA